jgi:hypothetical protein
MTFPKYSLRTGLIVFTVCLICVSIVGKREYDRRRAQQISEQLRSELETTRTNIENGQIHVDLPVATYLKIASPCEIQRYDGFTEYQHGFTGGLGYGLTVVAKNDSLVKAYSWSCLGGDTYFNSMTKSEETELDRQWHLANGR